MADGELRIGTRLDPGVPQYSDLREATELAERLGYEAVWVRDHVSLADTTGQEECHEVWTIMTALAAQTERIKVGSLVLCTPFRNPALLAKMGATLDHLSGGRLILGMGAGHKEAEFREYGYDFPRAGDRVTMLDEAAAIVRLMWTEHRPSFEGRFYRIEGALNVPKPVQQPTPTIMIGGDGPRMLRVIARRADAWNIAGGPEEFDGETLRRVYCCGTGDGFRFAFPSQFPAVVSFDLWRRRGILAEKQTGPDHQVRNRATDEGLHLW